MTVTDTGRRWTKLDDRIAGAHLDVTLSLAEHHVDHAATLSDAERLVALLKERLAIEKSRPMTTDRRGIPVSNQVVYALPPISTRRSPFPWWILTVVVAFAAATLGRCSAPTAPVDAHDAARDDLRAEHVSALLRIADALEGKGTPPGAPQ